MLHPSTRLAWIDDVIGLGVVATSRIPQGTVVWALDPLDLALTNEQVSALGGPYAAMLDRYAYRERGALILCWDHARFVNHHCDATCVSGEDGFELAARDIEVGEQLTDDYGALGLDYAMACSCGSARCRGEIRPDDPARLTTAWRQRYHAALLHSGNVPQPLAELVGVRLRRAQDRLMKPVNGAAASAG